MIANLRAGQNILLGSVWIFVQKKVANSFNSVSLYSWSNDNQGDVANGSILPALFSCALFSVHDAPLQSFRVD